VIWPPLAFVGIGRYDDPTQRISTLYASVQRRTAFLETLDGYRPNLSLLAQLDEDPAQLGWLPSVKTPDAPVLGVIPDPYFDRLIAEFKVSSLGSVGWTFVHPKRPRHYVSRLRSKS
jgi:hypothetical protein